jgi:hypothetical protein
MCPCNNVSFRYWLFWDVIQRRFKVQALQEEFFLDSLTLEDRTLGCPETLVTNHNSTLRNIPKVRTSDLHRCESLKCTFNKEVFKHYYTVCCRSLTAALDHDENQIKTRFNWFLSCAAVGRDGISARREELPIGSRKRTSGIVGLPVGALA